MRCCARSRAARRARSSPLLRGSRRNTSARAGRRPAPRLRRRARSASGSAPACTRRPGAATRRLRIAPARLTPTAPQEPSGEDSADGEFIPDGITLRCAESPPMTTLPSHFLWRKITYELHARYFVPKRRKAPVRGPRGGRDARTPAPEPPGSGERQVVRVEGRAIARHRSEEHTSELQSLAY